MITPEVIARFLSKIKIVESGCHEWNAGLNAYGYGQFSVNKKINCYAHRFSWQLKHGQIPLDLVVDHVCRNRKCVNVDHLRLITNKENVLCGVGPSAINAIKTHCIHGHILAGSNLYIEPANGKRRCRTCGYNKMNKSRKKRRANQS